MLGFTIVFYGITITGLGLMYNYYAHTNDVSNREWPPVFSLKARSQIKIDYVQHINE